MPKRPRKQLDLPMRTPRRWGGRRPGAGRKARPGALVLHRSREAFPRGVPCHVTLKARRDVPRLRTARLVQAFERSLAAASERGDFRVVHYSIQNDHVHLLVEAAHRIALGRGMKSIAARFARAVNRVFGRRGAVLRGRYHMRPLRTPGEVRNALAYVLLNAARHAAKRGHVAPRAPGGVCDPASSGRWFRGWRRPPVLVAGAGSAPEDPPTAPARSWLLRVGWRRHGLLDPAEVPGSKPR